MGFSSASADSALMDFDPPSRAQLTVDWSMVKTHFLSFAAALIPFPVLTFTADLMDADMLAFYDRAQLPGAIIIFVLVLLEIIAMYLQARNALETEMDRRLGVASHRNKDDIK